MKIIVCIKQVPDTNEVKLDPVTGTLIRDGVPSIINPDDKAGLEAALRLSLLVTCFSFGFVFLLLNDGKIQDKNKSK